MKKTNSSKLKTFWLVFCSFACGAVVTLLIVVAVTSNTHETPAFVSTYEQFGFREFNVEELEANDAYLAQLFMEAEKRRLQVVADNEVLYEQAIIDYFEDILKQLPKGKYSSDVREITTMLAHHQEELEDALSKQKDVNMLLKQMDEMLDLMK